MRKVLYILGELEDSDLQWIVDAGSLRPVDADDEIIREGGRIENVFIVVDGEFAVTKTDRAIARLGVGEIMGDMSFLDTRPPTASVTAATDGAVYAVPRAALRDKLEDDPPFAARFYRAMSLFLVDRLIRTNALVAADGDGAPAEDESQEISPETLGLVALAGARFDWFLQRVRRG